VAADRNYDETCHWIHPGRQRALARAQGQLLVEAARLRQMTDYEKLMIEVWTNGAITPQDSIASRQAGQRSHEHLHQPLKSRFEKNRRNAAGHRSRSRLEALDRSVESLNFPCVLQLPEERQYQTIRELVQKSENEMLKTKTSAANRSTQIKDILVKMGPPGP